MKDPPVSQSIPDYMNYQGHVVGSGKKATDSSMCKESENEAMAILGVIVFETICAPNRMDALPRNCLAY